MLLLEGIFELSAFSIKWQLSFFKCNFSPWKCQLLHRWRPETPLYRNLNKIRPNKKERLIESGWEGRNIHRKSCLMTWLQSVSPSHFPGTFLVHQEVVHLGLQAPPTVVRSCHFPPVLQATHNHWDGSNVSALVQFVVPSGKPLP